MLDLGDPRRTSQVYLPSPVEQTGLGVKSLFNPLQRPRRRTQSHLSALAGRVKCWRFGEIWCFLQHPNKRKHKNVLLQKHDPQEFPHVFWEKMALKCHDLPMSTSPFFLHDLSRSEISPTDLAVGRFHRYKTPKCSSNSVENKDSKVQATLRAAPTPHVHAHHM